MARFDIGVMPLTDDEWAKGKGGYKILQYMAMGIPSVASAVGINNDIIVDGTTGFLCRTREEWSDRLARLVNDASLRQRMARAARERALEHFSLKGARDGFIEILKGTP
jgi:glycosyltransferase involved in cell wall biosynthesis